MSGKKRFVRTKALLALLLILVQAPVVLADQLLEKCTSMEWTVGNGVELLLPEALKEKREDCLQALLSNGSFNIRSDALRAITLLAPSEQVVVLRSVLRADAAWVSPIKGGEMIASFSVLTSKYIVLFERHGVTATKEQLLSQDDRAELLRKLDGR